MPYSIVLAKFPFAENQSKSKFRPAVLVSNKYGKHDLVVVVFITSNLEDYDSKNDILIEDFTSYGLTKTSIIKPYKLASLPDSDIFADISNIESGSELESYLQSMFRKIFKL